MKSEGEFILECCELSKSYEEGSKAVKVLNAINFSLCKGESVAVAGSSGSGKTTLLNLLAGLDLPSTGTVKLQGKDLAKLTEVEKGELRNRKMGFVYQFHHLLSEFTALENTAMPLLIRGLSFADAYERSERLLKQVGLGHRTDHKPAELSGGERQRVAIARALVGEPDCVLMDEPTGNLDHQTASAIQSLLLSLCENSHISFIIVTHDQQLAQCMDKVYRLHDGDLLLEQKAMRAL